MVDVRLGRIAPRECEAASGIHCLKIEAVAIITIPVIPGSRYVRP
jgi:hypothetical protein